MTEKDRLDFVEKRDGIEAAITFAKQGAYLYINGAIDQSKYKSSIDEYKKFLAGHGFKVQVTILKEEDKDAD